MGMFRDDRRKHHRQRQKTDVPTLRERRQALLSQKVPTFVRIRDPIRPNRNQRNKNKAKAMRFDIGPRFRIMIPASEHAEADSIDRRKHGLPLYGPQVRELLAQTIRDARFLVVHRTWPDASESLSAKDVLPTEILS
jgi:hypothetical protein